MFVLEARRLLVSDDGMLPSREPERLIPVRGRFWVHLTDSPTLQITPGAALRVAGVAGSVRAPTNPGERDFRPIALEEGLAGHLEVPSGGLVTPIQHPTARERIRGRWMAWREASRSQASATLFPERSGSPGRALLAALLLGERDAAIRTVRNSFTRLGLSHLLAISGLNIVVLAAALTLLVRAALVLLPIPLAISWRLEPALVSLAVIVYLIILPVQPTILRAGIMTLALLIPPALGRRHDRVNTLGWTLVMILLAWPHELFSLGLQLSFGIVLALLTLTTPLRDRVFGAIVDPDVLSPPRRALRSMQTAFVAATVAWVVSIPCIAHHTGIMTPLAVPATMLAAPPVSLLSAWGYVSILISVAAPGAAEHLAPPMIAVADRIAMLAAQADDIPFAVIRVPRVSVWLALGAPLVAVSWLLVPRDALARPPRRWRIARALASTTIVAWGVGELRRPPLRSDVALRVDALDVGDGSCLLLRAGRAAALWDAGGGSFDLGVREIPDALRALNARNIHDVFITHANLDHFNALPDLLASSPIQRIHTTRHFLHAAQSRPDGPESETLRHAALAHVEVIAHVAGDVISIGPARVRVLWPPADLPLDTPDNDASLVARLEHADLPPSAGALLTGDIQAGTLRALLTDALSLRAHVLELPHHGSAGSMPASLDFVRAVQPALVLQSTGPSRLDDDRWDPVHSPRTRWLLTARSGALWGEILRDGSLRSGSIHPPRSARPSSGVSPSPRTTAVGFGNPMSKRVSAICSGATYPTEPRNAHRTVGPTTTPAGKAAGSTKRCAP